MGYKISDISKKTGLSAYTLRFYDQKGLLPFVARDKHGRRHFKDEDLAFLSINFIYDRAYIVGEHLLNIA